MSSLLQFDGQTGRRGVRLELTYQTIGEYVPGEGYTWTMREPVPCSKCGKPHEQIHIAWRRPVDMLGCWIRFRLNGHLIAPDLSIPINVDKMPRDARPLSAEENSAAWHRS